MIRDVRFIVTQYEVDGTTYDRLIVEINGLVVYQRDYIHGVGSMLDYMSEFIMEHSMDKAYTYDANSHESSTTYVPMRYVSDDTIY